MLKLKHKKIISYGVGFFFLILGIIAVVNTIYIGRLQQVLWLCYIGLILLGIGFIFRRTDLIIAQLSILTIPFLTWNIDFFYILFTKNSLWNITNYIFQNRSSISTLISLQHIYTIPLVLIALSFIKIKKKYVWKLAMIQMIIIFIIGRFFTSLENNVNCVFSSCVPIKNIFPYEIMWLLGMFIMVIITNFIINNLFFLYKRRKE